MAGRVTSKSPRRFFFNSDTHLSDERLADLFCHELSFLHRWVARRHLAKCAQCEARRQRLEGPRAERAIQLYRESLDEAEMILRDEPRAAFVSWLGLQMHHEASRQRLAIPSSARGRGFGSTFASASVGVALGLIVGVSAFLFLSWEREPKITANALLVRAERWDASGVAASPGVVRQTVQIKTKKETLKRSIYWDRQGKHRPKALVLSASEEQLRSTLREAGVDWNQPISASAYQDWHDHQHERADRIARSGLHLLTLTTTVPGGVVSEESLTVRDTDFHPVARSVGFRDSETVEIAEVDFAVLPWSAVAPDTFESVGAVGEHAISGPRLDLVPLLPARVAPTAEQLDDAELTARLILNELHADTGEQIEVRRLPEVIEVDGLVETEQRKRELESQLMAVPRLRIAIQSAANLRQASPDGDASSSADAVSLPDLPSVLERYLAARGWSIGDINAVEQQLFSDALTISQESVAIADLRVRFVITPETPVMTSATIVDLFYGHRARMQAALRHEHGLLAGMDDEAASIGRESGRVSGRAPAQASLSLAEEARGNLALVKELTRTDVPAQRSVQEVFADLFATMDRMASAAGKGVASPRIAGPGDEKPEDGLQRKATR